MNEDASDAQPRRSRTREVTMFIDSDFASLQAHMARCEEACGPLHKIRDWLEQAGKFVATRLVTSSAIFVLLVACIVSITS